LAQLDDVAAYGAVLDRRRAGVEDAATFTGTEEVAAYLIACDRPAFDLQVSKVMNRATAGGPVACEVAIFDRRGSGSAVVASIVATPSWERIVTLPLESSIVSWPSARGYVPAGNLMLSSPACDAARAIASRKLVWPSSATTSANVDTVNVDSTHRSSRHSSHKDEVERVAPIFS
jgi:hypothetical protein